MNSEYNNILFSLSNCTFTFSTHDNGLKFKSGLPVKSLKSTFVSIEKYKTSKNIFRRDVCAVIVSVDYDSCDRIIANERSRLLNYIEANKADQIRNIRLRWGGSIGDKGRAIERAESEAKIKFNELDLNIKQFMNSFILEQRSILQSLIVTCDARSAELRNRR